MTQTSTYVKSELVLNVFMRFLDSAHVIYVGEMKKIDINSFNKRSQSKYITEKIVADFELINILIDNYDLINAATILRATLENIFYIIAVNYDKKLKISLETTISDFRKVLKENENDCFFDSVDLDTLNRAYKYLCKLVHPCSMKEYLSYLTSTRKYRKYMQNNMRFVMVFIEYVYLSFLYKDDTSNSFYDVTAELTIFSNVYNIGAFSQKLKENKNFYIRFFFNDMDNKIIKENQEIIDEIKDALKNNPATIGTRLNYLINQFDTLLAQTEYCDVVNSILKRKNKIFV